MTDEIELAGLEKTPQNGQIMHFYGAGVTETETRQAISEIEDGTPITGAKRTIKQLCISLAMSIDKGNAKGRAIANEAAQLFAMMQQLAPPEEAVADESNLSPQLKRLFDVFASGPRFDTAPKSDGEEL